MDSAYDPIFERACFLAQRKCSPRTVLILIMYDLKAPVDKSGFGRLINVVLEAVSTGDIHIVANDLYIAVADKYESGTNFENIEYAIRTFIQYLWKIRSEEKWRQYFPENIVTKNKTPENLEVIAALANFVYIWMDLCEMEVCCHASK